MEESETETSSSGSVILDPLLEDKLRFDAIYEAIPANQTSQTILVNPTKACPACGSNHGQWRGYRSRKHGTTMHRRWCRACNHWFQLSTT